MVSTFLLKQLKRLTVEDPYKPKNSEEIVEDMQLEKFGRCTPFGIDDVDLYYSLPECVLMKCVKECIRESNDELRLQNDFMV